MEFFEYKLHFFNKIFDKFYKVIYNLIILERMFFMQEKNNKKTLVIVTIALLVPAIIAIMIITLTSNNISNNAENNNSSIFSFFNNIKNKKVTKDNYEDISNEISSKLGEDEELYYFSYAITYYTLQNSIINPDDDNAKYSNIYGKTVKELIDEGKKFMEETGMTIENFKYYLENSNNDTINE